jgi:hypothetical protein
MSLLEKIAQRYQKFDDGMMSAANAGVRAYNWTTGGTKAEFANHFETLNKTSFILFSFREFPVVFSMMTAPLLLLATHFKHLENKRLEEKEVEAAEKGAKDYEVEKRKSLSKLQGPVYFFAGSYTVNHGSGIMESYSQVNAFNLGISVEILGAGFIADGIGNYITRADTMPPRKDCVSRGIDTLKKYWQELGAEPAYSPALSRELE